MDDSFLFDETFTVGAFDHLSPMEKKFICEDCGLIKIKDVSSGKLKCPKCLKE